MDTGTVALVALAVAAGALVQGLSGLGFALVSAPVVSQLVPGTGGIGLVNTLSIVQNIWLTARIDAAIAWREIRRMVPGLILGVLIGWTLLRFGDPRWYQLIVAASATGSIIWLLLADRFRGRVAGLASAVWGAAVNTVAGVGGPPLAAYLVTRGLGTASYIRTLQVLFAALSLVSLPMLGVTIPSFAAFVVWLLALIGGSVCGEALHRVLPEGTAQRIARVTIVLVCLVALGRSVLVLATGA